MLQHFLSIHVERELERERNERVGVHSTGKIRYGLDGRTVKRLSATMAKCNEFLYAESSCSDMFIILKTNIRRVSINLIRMEIAIYKRAMAEP